MKKILFIVISILFFVPASTQAFFETKLSPGDTHPDVIKLQKYLNTHGYPVASVGIGSPGFETAYFGNRTRDALIRFQNNTPEILTCANTTSAIGVFGYCTRKYVNGTDKNTDTSQVLKVLITQLNELIRERDRLLSISPKSKSVSVATTTQTIKKKSGGGGGSSSGGIRYTLTASYSGNGQIIANDNNISCGSDCVQSYSSGASVVLTATPASGYAFLEWFGCDSATHTCAITMNQNTAISAVFVDSNRVGCNCESTDPNAPCLGKSISESIPSVSSTFEWSFNCSGSSCQCGRFVTDDYWVRSPDGGSVTITSVTPSGNENGLMIDPTNSFATNGQGLLGNGIYYSTSSNLMYGLPYSVTGRKTLVKAERCLDGSTCIGNYTAICGGYAAKAYSMLTVLDILPSDGVNGRNTFRPTYIAGAKEESTLGDFDFSRLPNRTDVALSQSGLNTMLRWGKPYPDVFGGDAGRCFVPGYYPDEYAAGIGVGVINDILALLGNKATLNATSSIVAMTQRGLDIYHSWKAGNKWDCGAGQCFGRKPPMVFMGALTRSTTTKAEIQASAATNSDFQEDTQISATPNSNGEVLWGANAYWGGSSAWPNLTPRYHWGAVFASKCFDGANGGNPAASCRDADNTGSAGDPYGYIDGPSGLPTTQYSVCCSGGNHIGYASIMHAWDAYCEAAHDDEPIRWADKMYYPNAVSAPGVLLSQDNCAPPDPRESESCDGFSGTGCLYFGGRSGATDGNSTWGPLPSNLSQCIPNNSGGNTGQTGRFSWLTGQRFMNFSSSAGSLSYNAIPGYFPSIAQAMYATFRTVTPHCTGGVWNP